MPPTYVTSIGSGTTTVSSGTIASGVTVQDNTEQLQIGRGGSATSTTVSSGGLFTVYAHGTADTTTVVGGGEEDVFGGIDTGASVFDSSGSGLSAVQSVGYSGSAVAAQVSAGGIPDRLRHRHHHVNGGVERGRAGRGRSGGTANNTTVSAGGVQNGSRAARRTTRPLAPVAAKSCEGKANSR